LKTALLIAASAALLLAGCANEETPTGTASKLPPPLVEPPADPDTEPPVVSVGPLSPEQTSFRFAVAVDATDSGSGVADFELWVAPASGGPTLVGTFTASPVAFHADTSGTHTFWAVATDSAGNRSAPPAVPDALTNVPERIVIVDVNGEHFDITNPVHRYNMQVVGWQYGLGRDAFNPITFPDLIHHGEADYPSAQSTFDLLGVSAGPSARAYPIDDFIGREVANDTLAGVHLAATY
jgi:hypothetical protein